MPHQRSAARSAHQFPCGWRRGPRRAWATHLAATTLWLAGAGWALLSDRAWAQADLPCTVVFGHGRNVSADDESANMQWDEINRTLASQVALDIADRDIRTVLVLAPVVVTDLQRIVDILIDNARKEGCDRIVETTFFAQDKDLLVARLREYPIVRDGERMRIGEPRFTNQQEYPNTQRNRDRLVPAALGKSFAAEYLQQRVLQ